MASDRSKWWKLIRESIESFENSCMQYSAYKRLIRKGEQGPALGPQSQHANCDICGILCLSLAGLCVNVQNLSCTQIMSLQTKLIRCADSVAKSVASWLVWRVTYEHIQFSGGGERTWDKRGGHARNQEDSHSISIYVCMHVYIYIYIYIYLCMYFNQQNKQCTTPSSQQTYIKLFYRNQMHYNYKSDEKILKTLIHKNILPTDPNKKIKLVIYYNKFKTSNLVVRNNSSPSIGVLQKTNVIYKFKCPLGDCISDNNNIYVGLTSTTLSRRLTMHLSDTSSIAQHLKKHSCPTAQLRKILTDNTTILEHQNNKQKLQILEALHIRNLQPTLNRINFQTSANVLKCL